MIFLNVYMSASNYKNDELNNEYEYHLRCRKDEQIKF